MRKAEFTEKARRASTTEPDFIEPELSVFDVEVSPLLDVEVPEGLVRTRSAQDFGFGGEGTAAWLSFSASPSSLFEEVTKVCKFCVVSDGDVCVPASSDAISSAVSDTFSGASSFAVAFCEAVGCIFDGIDTFGVTGTIGTTGLVAVRVWVDEEVAREVEGATVVVDGVGGCVDSASEGTSDVAGVSWFEDAAATVELCELVHSSTALVLASVCNA